MGIHMDKPGWRLAQRGLPDFFHQKTTQVARTQEVQNALRFVEMEHNHHERVLITALLGDSVVESSLNKALFLAGNVALRGVDLHDVEDTDTPQAHKRKRFEHTD